MALQRYQFPGTKSILAKREREGLDTGIEKFNLEGRVFDSAFLPDELVHPGLSNLACAIGGGIHAMIVARRVVIQLHSEANGCTVLLGA